MRQQEGIDDDHQHDRAGHEKVVHGRTGQQEVDYDDQEVVNQEEDGHGCLVVNFAGSITVSYSVTARFAAPGRGSQHFG